MSKSDLGDEILATLVNTAPTENNSRLEILFQDFVAEAIRGEKHYESPSTALCTGITERAVRLGLYASAQDMDDVDWKVLTHPGSIIWPVATAIGVQNSLPLEQLFAAATYGYRTGATIANFFISFHHKITCTKRFDY